jgi:hypothetical protein
MSDFYDRLIDLERADNDDPLGPDDWARMEADDERDRLHDAGIDG